MLYLCERTALLRILIISFFDSSLPSLSSLTLFPFYKFTFTILILISYYVLIDFINSRERKSVLSVVQERASRRFSRPCIAWRSPPPAPSSSMSTFFSILSIYILILNRIISSQSERAFSYGIFALFCLLNCFDSVFRLNSSFPSLPFLDLLTFCFIYFET